jgi:hypothetical protein
MQVYYNNYLLQCDYIYKQKSKDIYSSRKLKTVELSLSLNNSGLDTDLGLDSQLKIFFMMYLSYSLSPFVGFSNKNKDNLDLYILKFRFSGKDLSFLFREFFDPFYFQLYNFILSQNFLNLRSADFHTFNCDLSFLNSYTFKYYLKDFLHLTSAKDLNFFALFTLKK